MLEIDLAAVELIAWSFGANPGRWVTLAVWHLPVAFRILVILIGGAILFAVLWMLGELVIHGIIQVALKGAMAILEAIERNTPTGTTGILGFILLFLGFLGQFTGTIASAH